jgi:hypothetical protein
MLIESLKFRFPRIVDVNTLTLIAGKIFGSQPNCRDAMSVEQEQKSPLFAVLKSFKHSLVYLGFDPDNGTRLSGSFSNKKAILVPLRVLLELLTNAPNAQIGNNNMLPYYDAYVRDIFRTMYECTDPRARALISCNVCVFILLCVSTTKPIFTQLCTPEMFNSPAIMTYMCVEARNALSRADPPQNIIAMFMQYYIAGMKAFFPNTMAQIEREASKNTVKKCRSSFLSRHSDSDSMSESVTSWPRSR